MAYCQGCGRYIGDYSAYRQEIPGRGELVLCYQCRRWADRHPGQTQFPARKLLPQEEIKRVRALASTYMIGAAFLFVLGIALIGIGRRSVTGLLLFLGAISLFFIGLGMRRFAGK